MSAEIRAVIEAVLEALDIPYAATDGHDKTRQAILDHRLMHTLVCLRDVQQRADTPYPADLNASLAYLRERLAEHPPVGYVTYEQAHRRLKAGMDWMQAVALDEEADR